MKLLIYICNKLIKEPSLMDVFLVIKKKGGFTWIITCFILNKKQNSFFQKKFNILMIPITPLLIALLGWV